MVKPGLAVGYHFYNDFDIAPEVKRRDRIGRRMKTRITAIVLMGVACGACK